MKNLLSIDLEYWYSAELIEDRFKNSKDDLITEMTLYILNILEKKNITSTFFVLGKIAEKYPDLVELIYEAGHEIASHSYSHINLHKLGKENFEKEIKKSIQLLKGITKKPVRGFRAPTFSIDNKTMWALDVLEENEFKYDSSIFPLKTGLYGVSNSPFDIYHPSATDVSKKGNRKIMEIPMTIAKYNKIKVPISGGFYLRAIPYSFLKLLINKVNEDRPAIIYLHPWEICPIMPRLKLKPIPRFITYINIDKTAKKFEMLLRDFKFQSLEAYLNES